MEFRMKKGLITLLLCATISVVFASQLVISKPLIFIKNEFLATSFKIPNLLGQKEIKTIKSGFTTTIKIKVELWRKGILFHNLKTDRKITKEISYDIWKEIYTLKLDNLKILKFNDLKELEEVLAQEETILISPLKKLHNKERYFIRVEVDVESINEKEMQEITRRINGDSSPGPIDVKKIFAVLVKHQTQDIKSYVQSDCFRVDRFRSSND